MQVCHAGDYIFQDKNAAGYHAHTDVHIYTYTSLQYYVYTHTHTNTGNTTSDTTSPNRHLENE